MAATGKKLLRQSLDIGSSENRGASFVGGATVHKGWMHKRTHSWFTKWDRRYFVLDRKEKTLCWWRRQRNYDENDKPVCVISLTGSVNVVLTIPEKEVGTSLRKPRLHEYK